MHTKLKKKSCLDISLVISTSFAITTCRLFVVFSLIKQRIVFYFIVLCVFCQCDKKMKKKGDFAWFE